MFLIQHILGPYQESILLHQQNTQRECISLIALLLSILVCSLTEVDDVQEEVSQVLMLLTLETYGRVYLIKNVLQNEIVGEFPIFPYTVEPPNRGHFWTTAFVLSSEAALFSEVV